MFGSKKSGAPQARIESLIGAGTRVEGHIIFAGGLRIDGAVIGNVSSEGASPATLVISEKAVITGDVRVAHVVVNGQVNGPVHADALLELQAGARITGDVSYKTLEMQPGAVVDGRLVHLVQDVSPVVEFKRSANAE
jgi:cytoskeletal protein CcmA (bactofilin family)